MVALPNTHVCLINSEFVGCSGNVTAGIVLVKPSSAVISLCRFQRFKGGAVYSIAEEKNEPEGIKPSEFIMQDSEIMDCGLMAVYL